MAKSQARRVQALETKQAQRHAAVQAVARERVLRQVLEELDPQWGDAHLEYPALLARVIAVLRVEQRRVAAE